MSKIEIKTKNENLIKILNGLSLLNGINSVKLGIIRAEIEEIVEAKQKKLEAGLKNEEWEKYEREAAEVNAKYADDVAKRTAELAAINRKGAEVLRNRNNQISEFQKILEEETIIELERFIPLSLLPESQTPNNAIPLLKLVIDFDA